jgi:hypothetical protein
MTPDAVQYARALRPPYHLLSFLRSAIYLPPTLLSQVSLGEFAKHIRPKKKFFQIFLSTSFSWNL